MQKPTNSEIKEAIENIEDSVYAGILPNNYTVGFKMAVEWFGTWQKSQPLTVYVVRSKKNLGSEIVSICRTKESAEIIRDSLATKYEDDFSVTPIII